MQLSLSTVDAAVERLWSEVQPAGATIPAHPFPEFDMDSLKQGAVIRLCSVVLFLGAVLCSAGGIGGGGIYVTVLMTAGALNPHDAVPLSKAVVFFGSLTSLFLNVKKALVMQEESQTNTLIDFNVCRIVVPCALLGTLLGVMVNSLISSFMIVAMLVFILVAMSFMSSHKFYHQYRGTDQGVGSEQSGGDSTPRGPAKQDATSIVAEDVKKEASEGHIRGALRRGEGFGAFFLLIFVIASGVFRQHAENCRSDVVQGAGVDSCLRPVMKFVVGNSLVTWMSHSELRTLVPLLAVVIPAIVCLLIAGLYSNTLMKQEGWTMKQVCSYSTMALFTGCFAGLVGIGGGLVFSPFMLWMGLHPSIAVATSSTCVIFTSSSTTMQYLFTDRIIISLALLYGVVASVASYIGTSGVHVLQDRYHARPYYISGVVCLGVFASVVLSVYKLAHFPPAIHIST